MQDCDIGVLAYYDADDLSPFASMGHLSVAPLDDRGG
jgi:hypothetical protein